MDIGNLFGFMLRFSQINSLLRGKPLLFLVLLVHSDEERLGQHLLRLFILKHGLLLVIIVGLDIRKHNKWVLLDWLVERKDHLVEVDLAHHEVKHLPAFVLVLFQRLLLLLVLFKESLVGKLFFGFLFGLRLVANLDLHGLRRTDLHLWLSSIQGIGELLPKVILVHDYFLCAHEVLIVALVFSQDEVHKFLRDPVSLADNVSIRARE